MLFSPQTTLLETLYETEFFPKTVFDTRLGKASNLVPSTVIQTSTTTSTFTRVRVEPVYVTETEIEPTSITTTVTRLVFDTNQHFQSLMQTKFTPQIITTTVFKEVFHADVETVTRSRTVTVTQTESVIGTDCPGSDQFHRSSLYSRSYDPFSPPYRASSSLLSNDLYSDISQANSDAHKTFTEPLPTSDVTNSNFLFDTGFQIPHYSKHFNPMSLYNPGNYGSPNNPFQSFHNKMFKYFGTSHPTKSFQRDQSAINLKSPQKESISDGDYLYEGTGAYSPFTLNDIRLRPSRPDPTSISDIIDEVYSQENQNEIIQSARVPKQLYGSEDNAFYSPDAVYFPNEYRNLESSLREGQITVNDYTADGGAIHIKEIMKGVKGGEIHEEIHNHGLAAEQHSSPQISVNTTDQDLYKSLTGLSYQDDNQNSLPVFIIRSPHVSQPPQDDRTRPPVYEYNGKDDVTYDSQPLHNDRTHPPVYEYKGQNDVTYDSHYPDSGLSRTNLLQLLQNTLKFDKYRKQIYPLVPKEVEDEAIIHRPKNTEQFLKHRFPPSDLNYVAPNHSYPKQTLYRSEYPKTKLSIENNIMSTNFGDLGSHSTPVVTNISGDLVTNMFNNTSSNTFTPSQLLAVTPVLGFIPPPEGYRTQSREGLAGPAPRDLDWVPTHRS